MLESAEEEFLSSNPTSAERFLSMERIAETFKQGNEPTKVFAANKPD
jgi:hypothetical protein